MLFQRSSQGPGTERKMATRKKRWADLHASQAYVPSLILSPRHREARGAVSKARMSKRQPVTRPGAKLPSQESSSDIKTPHHITAVVASAYAFEADKKGESRLCLQAHFVFKLTSSFLFSTQVPETKQDTKNTRREKSQKNVTTNPPRFQRRRSRPRDRRPRPDAGRRRPLPARQARPGGLSPALWLSL